MNQTNININTQTALPHVHKWFLNTSTEIFLINRLEGDVYAQTSLANQCVKMPAKEEHRVRGPKQAA